MAQLRSEITVTVDDKDAQQALNELLQKLERAQKLGESVGFGVGPGAPGGGPGRPGGGDGVAGDQTGTTADNQGGRVSGNLAGRAIQGAGRAAQQGAQIVTGGQANAAWSIQLAGRAVEGLADTLHAGLTKIADEAGDTLSSIPIAGIFSQVAATAAVTARVGTQLLGEAVTARYAQVMKLANLERPMAGARVMGGFSGGMDAGYLGDAAGLGFRPQEAAATMSQFSRSIGVAGGGAAAYGAGVDPFRATLSGLSPEMMARYLSLGGPGAGGVTGPGGAATETVGGAAGALRSSMGLVQSFGLRGAKVDEALARISSATTQMAEQGLVLNLGSVAQTMADLEATGAAQAGGGRNVFGGMNAVRGATKLSQIPQQAAQRLTQPFAGLGQAALMAWAAKQGAKGPLQAAEMIQELAQDPGAVRAAMVGELGEEAGTAAFSGTGFSVAQARVLAGPQTSGQITQGMRAGAMGGAGEGDVPLSAMLSRQERLLMGIVASDEAANAALISGMQNIQLAMIDLSKLTNKYLMAVEASMRMLTD